MYTVRDRIINDISHRTIVPPMSRVVSSGPCVSKALVHHSALHLPSPLVLVFARAANDNMNDRVLVCFLHTLFWEGLAPPW